MLINVNQVVQFQSTQPMRAATLPLPAPWPDSLYFNPRSPCGLRLFSVANSLKKLYFNPRSPCGLRLTDYPLNSVGWWISIHAAHAGCDSIDDNFNLRVMISIHAAHAGCDVCIRTSFDVSMLFQSTQPMRAATCMDIVGI